MNNGLEEEEAMQLTDEIISALDTNHDGRISLEEFTDGYIEIIKKLRNRQIEMEDKMLDSYEQYKHCEMLLHETQCQPDDSYFQK